jgi:hypothetical protein
MAEALEKAPHISAVFQRNTVADERESFERAHSEVTAVLDTYSLFTFEPPKLLPVVIACEEGNEKARVSSFDFEGTGEVYIGEAAEKFQKRTPFLLKRLLLAFDLSLSDGQGYQTELAERLRVFARMVRHGRTAHNKQVQYLCKFTAIENLVCGSRPSGRGPLLKQRLPALFKQRLTSQRVDELWKLRCGASHEGSGDWVAFVGALADIDYLVIGCAVFAVDHLDSVANLEDLWNRVEQYQLPAEMFVDAISFAAQSAFKPLATFDSKIFKWNEIFAGVGTRDTGS